MSEGAFHSAFIWLMPVAMIFAAISWIPFWFRIIEPRLSDELMIHRSALCTLACCLGWWATSMVLAVVAAGVIANCA